MAGVRQFLGSVAALPFGLAGSAAQRLINGPCAVVEVTVRRIEDVHERNAFLHRLRRLAHDPTVAAVLLRLQEAPGGWAASQDLRGAIATLRASGRPVYGWLESAGNALMWIGAATDRLFLAPTGEVGLVGVGVELTFYGSALERLGVRPDFEAAGAYKSFGEPFTRTYASSANQEAMGDLVLDLHDQLVADIAADRGLEADAVRVVLDRAPVGAPDAVVAGLVDQLAYTDQLDEWLDEQHGPRNKRVSFAAWTRRDAVLEWIEQWGAGGTRIAVLHLQGPIVMEDGGRGTQIVARRVVPLLAAMREDDRVGAVVLHVDSPGGSALASDLMWREVDQLARAKPVVASFEDVAASGGYYLSAPAREIVARSTTLTGSIGVFGGKMVVAEGLRKLGVHSQEILGAPNANLYSPSRRFSPGQRVRFKESLQRFYDGFVQRVADGRNVDEEVIEPHCRGRVWTGRTARARQLVDRFGDLDVAVERARIHAGLDLGGFIRRDVAAHRVSWAARVAGRAMRQASPLGASVQWLEQLVVGPSRQIIEVLWRHQGQAMAMLPFDLRPK